MRKFFMTAFVLAAAVLVATSSFGLEKTAARMEENRADVWSQDYSCSVAYYNICTGWIWIWTGWSPGDMFGSVLTPCCTAGETAHLGMAEFYCWTGAPGGYGFTGTLGVYDAPGGNCLGAPLAVFPLLPASYWNYIYPAVNIPIGSTFALVRECGPGTGTPEAWVTDHPAAGPTGPQACGYCYPTTRVTHAFYFGTAASPLCPGSVLNDGICDCEMYGFWADFNCIVGVEDSSWGTIKGLYR